MEHKAVRERVGANAVVAEQRAESRVSTAVWLCGCTAVWLPGGNS